MHTRNQLSSDGTLRTWRWPARLGNSYIGDQVHMTIEHLHLSVERVEELKRSEERTRVMDMKVQKNLHGSNTGGTRKSNYRTSEKKDLSVLQRAWNEATNKQRGENNGEGNDSTI